MQTELVDSTGATAVRHDASRSASGVGGVWQKKFTLNGWLVLALIAVELVAHRSQRQHRTRQRAQAAGVRDGNRQRASLDAGHGRLNDRQLDVDEFANGSHFASAPGGSRNGSIGIGEYSTSTISRVSVFFGARRTTRSPDSISSVRVQAATSS